MHKKYLRVCIAAWILSILGLSLYGGFSYHAEKFCTVPPSLYSGRNGSVAIWLQRFGSTSIMFLIIWGSCIQFSHCVKWFSDEKHEMNRKSRTNKIKKFGLYLFDFIFAYFLLDGFFILIYVPTNCTYNSVQDNYCYVTMLVVIIAEILTVILFGCIISPEETLALEDSYASISVEEVKK